MIESARRDSEKGTETPALVLLAPCLLAVSPHSRHSRAVFIDYSCFPFRVACASVSGARASVFGIRVSAIAA